MIFRGHLKLPITSYARMDCEATSLVLLSIGGECFWEKERVVFFG